MPNRTWMTQPDPEQHDKNHMLHDHSTKRTRKSPSRTASLGGIVTTMSRTAPRDNITTGPTHEIISRLAPPYTRKSTVLIFVFLVFWLGFGYWILPILHFWAENTLNKWKIKNKCSLNSKNLACHQKWAKIAKWTKWVRVLYFRRLFLGHFSFDAKLRTYGINFSVRAPVRV